jgi:hypothetical protein
MREMLPYRSWTPIPVDTVDGLDTFFVAKVTGNGSDRYAKLHCDSVAELVVSGAVFQA